MSQRPIRTLYPPLPAAVRLDVVERTASASPHNVVRAGLLAVANELIDLQSSEAVLGRSSTDRFNSSLKVIHGRLQQGQYSPYPGLDNHKMQAFVRMSAQAPKTTIPSAMERPLEDFEDLYYVIVATVKEIHEIVILKLNNNFVEPNAPLSSSSQLTFDLLREWLVQQWGILNEPSFVLALDMAVRKTLVNDHLCQRLRDQIAARQITHKDAEISRAQLYESECFNDMPGLSWVANEPAAMINCRLNEKYRIVLQKEREADEKIKRRAKRKDLLQKRVSKRRASRELYQKRQQAPEHARQGVEKYRAMTQQHPPRGELEPAEQEFADARRQPQQHVGQTGRFGGLQPLLQDEIDALRVYYTQQRTSSSKREAHSNHHHHHHGKLRRRKTPPPPPVVVEPAYTQQQRTPSGQQATQTVLPSLRGVTAACTPRRQVHSSSTQPHATQPDYLQQSTRTGGVQGAQKDARASVAENAFPGASPRDDEKASRVTEYQAWLNRSASGQARCWVGGYTGPTRLDTRGSSAAQGLAGNPTDTDTL